MDRRHVSFHSTDKRTLQWIYYVIFVNERKRVLIQLKSDSKKKPEYFYVRRLVRVEKKSKIFRQIFDYCLSFFLFSKGETERKERLA